MLCTAFEKRRCRSAIWFCEGLSAITKTLYKFATVILITSTEDLGGGVIWGRGGMIISATYNHDFMKKEVEAKKKSADE
jgi:hypothetical protein